MNENDQLNDLAHIRGLMDRSTRFLSLSGLSGVIAGVLALGGALVAQWYINDHLDIRNNPLTYAEDNQELLGYWDHIRYLTGVGLTVLVLALLGAFWFTWRRSRKVGQSLFDRTAQRMVLNMLMPLLAGGIFCLALFSYGLPGLVPATTLVFYGLALFSASKYTLDEIRWLGLSELILGLVALFWIGAGLMFWAIGFGVLHIFYGALMYLRHERGAQVQL